MAKLVFGYIQRVVRDHSFRLCGESRQWQFGSMISAAEAGLEHPVLEIQTTRLSRGDAGAAITLDIPNLM